MTLVNILIWDEWNREHLAKHHISPDEIEEVCQGKHKSVQSYRHRLLLIGQTKSGRKLSIVLSPKDNSLQPYGKGIYYVITAFETKIKL